MPVPSSINDLSTTASLNSPPGTEQVFPALDDYLRFIQACLALLRDGGGYLSSVSGLDTITATLTGLSSYQAGAVFAFVPAGANTGAVTLNIGGLGAKPVTYRGAALQAGFFAASVPVLVAYDGANFDVMADPTPVDRFSAQTIAGIKTFSVAPRSSAAAVAATELVRKQEMDAATSAAGFVGQIAAGARLTAPMGWLLVDGKTIGSAASGATSRANADTSELFGYLWAFTAIPIYDSTGAPTTRGASAAVDFAANKRLPLFTPDGGVFLRTWAPGQTIDAGRAAGSLQSDAIRTTTGSAESIVTDLVGASSGALSLSAAGSRYALTPDGGGGQAYKTLTLSIGSGLDTHPYNLAVPHYIRYLA